jgi:hypothetical protein
MERATQAPNQKTQPRGKKADGSPPDPIEIPVPKREDFDKLVKRAAKGSSKRRRGK